MTIKYACIEKRRGCIWIPRNTCGYPVWTIELISCSIFKPDSRYNNAIYLCKEGCIYVAGNYWMYEVFYSCGDPITLTGITNLTYANTKSGLWYSYYDYKPLLFVKTSRVKLLFS
jgi:hypothetical protein